MFLAWKEIKHSKGRYALIIGIIFLISYLVFFLTGLAYGLAQDGRMAADKWDATGIVMAKDADVNLNLSQFDDNNLKNVSADKKAILLQGASIAELKDKPSDKSNVSLFGINKDQFIAPNITKGRMFSKENEVVISDKLAKENHFTIGKEIKLTGQKKTLKIVGLTDNAMFNVAPVIYMSQQTFNNLSNSMNTNNINAIVVKNKNNNLQDVKVRNSNLKAYPMNTFIQNLPGYQAQVMTFELMIGSLILIAAIILGIFIYILTIQKKTIFGVMKVQGISSSFIAKSVVLQTFILGTVGVLLGALMTFATQMFLPQSMPFSMNIYFYIGIAVLMILFTIIGSLFSMRSIFKIDPLEALS